MSKRIVSDTERKELLAKYKADKLNDAPQNITDATLIKNYGTDEQKALLEPATPATTAKKDEAPAGTTDGAGAENAGTTGALTDEQEREKLYGVYFEVTGQERVDQLVESLDNIELPQLRDLVETHKAKAAHDADTTSTEYITELNNYLALHENKAPESQLKLSQLKEANANRILELRKPETNKTVSETLNKNSNPANPNLQSTFTNKNVEKVRLVNTSTGQVRSFARHTYDNYIKNDKDWTMVPETPDEVKHLTGENG